MRELDKVIGYETIKTELYRFIDIIREPEKYRALGVKIPRGILLDGAPGIGKTLMSQCFIKECGRKAFVIRKDRSDGEFVNHIKKTFEQAAAEEPSIILLDDVDKFANEDDAHRDAEEYVTVQACIDEFKDRDIFVIATTNSYRDLPDSLVRRGRFDKTFHMSFPRNEDAEKIISFYLKDKALADDIDVKEIARISTGHSCADLESVINEAGILAGFGGKENICQEDLKEACMHAFWGLRKLSADYPEESIRRKAIHEAGHAAMAEYFNPGCVTFISLETNFHRSDAMVLRKNDENRDDSMSSKEAEIMISLAGKAATELITGEVDMGARDDIGSAHDITTRLIDDVAAYDFQSWCHGEETSQLIYDRLDTVKGAEVARYYLNAKQILMKNREFLEALIDLVIEKKTVTYKDIALLREKRLGKLNRAA